MNRQRMIPLFLLLAAMLVLGACLPFGGQAPDDENVLSTLAMQTVAAQQTQALFETLVAQLTATPAVLPPGEVETPTEEPTAQLQSTSTQVPPTNTPPPPTATVVLPTSTPVIPTATATVVPCNLGSFVSDITVKDGTEFAPGESFTKTWRLQNVGSCTWNPDYELIFASGDAMGGPNAQKIGVTVRPGDTVDVSVKLIAPQKTGDHTGNWQLRSSGGVVFGIGKTGQSTFWVKIRVKSVPSEEGLLYDFAANYCAAEWRSNHGVVTCPTGANEASQGSVTRSYSPVFEGGYKDDQATIILMPGSGDGGVITGTFPAYKVRDGDDFSAHIGCMDKKPKCDVTFQLNYIADGGPVQNFATWTQKSDGSFERILLDLNSLAGKSVQFILTVYNNGDSTDDQVFWLLPAIR